MPCTAGSSIGSQIRTIDRSLKRILFEYPGRNLWFECFGPFSVDVIAFRAIFRTENTQRNAKESGIRLNRTNQMERLDWEDKYWRYAFACDWIWNTSWGFEASDLVLCDPTMSCRSYAAHLALKDRKNVIRVHGSSDFLWIYGFFCERWILDQGIPDGNDGGFNFQFRRWISSVLKSQMHNNGPEVRSKRVFSASNPLKSKKSKF